MKKLIPLLLIAFFNCNLASQTKQNDATWEETIAFIKKYSYHFDYPKNLYLAEDRIENFNIDSNTIGFKRIQRDNTPYSKWLSTSLWSVPLKKLDAAKVSQEINGLYLFFTGDYCTVKKEEVNFKKNTKELRSYKTNGLGLVIKDVEMRQRMIKAFKHLAYLAKQKRLKNRQRDKF